MIHTIHKYTIPYEDINEDDYDNLPWNGLSVSDNGWFYTDLHRHLIQTDWKIGFISSLINPEVLDIFEADPEDDYCDYGFGKVNDKWYRVE